MTAPKCKIQNQKYKNSTRYQMYKSKYQRHSYLSYCWQRKKDLFCESFIESIISKVLLNVILRRGCSIVKTLNN